MVTQNKKVLVAISGGVDSSTAAALLLEKGFDCAGVFMITSDNTLHLQADAEDVAKRLGIELAVLDLRKDFESIIDYFWSEYKKGRTPNPCVLCNRLIKFGKLWQFAKEKGADFLATGHYAIVLDQNSHIGLYENIDPIKDQSYVLSMIDKEILPHIMLPLGNYSKKQVRLMAANFGLGTENRKESQEICFVPNDDYTALLEQRHPELVRAGDIIDNTGKVLGQHTGIHRFTIGQRRGLNVAMGSPYYVARIDAVNNTVVLGPQEDVMHRQLRAIQVNWLIETPTAPFKAKVKIRYNDKGSPATIYPNENTATVEFDQPKLAITPGQLAVFYLPEQNINRVVGGGWIEEAAD